MNTLYRNCRLYASVVLVVVLIWMAIVMPNGEAVPIVIALNIIGFEWDFRAVRKKWLRAPSNPTVIKWYTISMVTQILVILMLLIFVVIEYPHIYISTAILGLAMLIIMGITKRKFNKAIND